MAAMRTSVGRLYMLFDACLPKNEKVKKRLNICKITESNEYNELKNYTPFAKQFEKIFLLYFENMLKNACNLKKYMLL